MLNAELVKRIISSVAILGIIFILYYIGMPYIKGLAIFVVLTLSHEIYTNFLGKNYKHIEYLFTQLMLIGILYFSLFSNFLHLYILPLSIFVIFLNLLFLFFIRNSTLFIDVIKKYSFLFIPLFIGVPFASSFTIFSRSDMWGYLIILMFLITFGVDTGAWFVGKLCGKHKLWESISPNKTIEGSLGGLAIGAFLAYLFYLAIGINFHFSYLIIFIIIGVIAQLGDLTQSKFKRFCNIKDSSTLIPGHGGLYDRVDSLIFVMPFFAIFIDYAF